MALATSRPTDPPAFFRSWAEYLAHWPSHTGEKTFCNALTAIYHPVVDGELARISAAETDLNSKSMSDVDRAELTESFAAEREGLRLRQGFPWVTPILGSGCLSLSESSAAPSVEQVPRVLAEVSCDFGMLPEGQRAATAIKEFALSLVGSKLGAAAASRASQAQLPHDWTAEPRSEIAARAILCARLLTRLYFEAGAMAEGILTSNTGTFTISTALSGPQPKGAELNDLFVAPLKDQLSRLADSVTTLGDQVAFVAEFARAVLKDLTLTREQVTVTGSDAALMAEIAWHFMTEGTSQYPGWSDLLTQLTIASDSAERSHRWPHLKDLSAARRRLHSDIIQTTIDSWKSRVETDRINRTRTGEAIKSPKKPARSVRDDLYDSVAELLISQANRHVGSVKEGAEQWPPAVAFVTSFDLELEMALMAKRSRFRLVVPFYVRKTSETSGVEAFVWLQTVVEAIPVKRKLTADDLYDLRVTRGWTLLTSQSDPITDDFSIPIVVRVAGSPLIKVAGIDELAEDEQAYESEGDANAAWIQSLKATIGGASMTLAGSVLLDEYTALHQWAAELAQPPGAKDQDERLGLPERMFKGGNDSTDARFWLVLGVQLSDEAVRHRTAAVVSTADLRSKINKPRRTTLRAGVVVNRRTTPNQRDVFLWQGLDVVAATYEEVLPAIRHMASHADKPTKRRFIGERCGIESPR